MPKVSSAACIICGVHDPQPPRSASRRAPSDGWLSIIWNIGSLPDRKVQRSASMASSEVPASNTGVDTRHAPCDNAARIDRVVPATWKNGRALKYRSPGPRPIRRAIASALRSMLSWLNCTPFGNEVLPEVYWISTTSSGAARPVGTGWPSPAARKSSHRQAPPGMSSPSTATWRNRGSAVPGSAPSIAGSIPRSMPMKSTFRKRSATASTVTSACDRQ